MNDAETQDKIAQAKAQLAELAAARAARETEAAAARELADLQAQVRDAQIVDAAEKEHGPLASRDEAGNLVGGSIARYDTPRGAVVVKRPSHLIFRRFTDAGKLNTDTCLGLIKPSLVHPPRDEFEAWVEEYPGIVLPLANLVSSLAGVRSTDTAGK